VPKHWRGHLQTVRQRAGGDLAKAETVAHCPWAVAGRAQPCRLPAQAIEKHAKKVRDSPIL
jgi:hypothetical protein